MLLRTLKFARQLLSKQAEKRVGSGSVRSRYQIKDPYPFQKVSDTESSFSSSYISQNALLDPADPGKSDPGRNAPDP